jgi:hypothetical protein
LAQALGLWNLLIVVGFVLDSVLGGYRLSRHLWREGESGD